MNWSWQRDARSWYWGVLEHFLQGSAEVFAGKVCADVGADWEELSNEDLGPFADATQVRLSPVLGRMKARFAAGVIQKLGEKGV